MGLRCYTRTETDGHRHDKANGRFSQFCDCAQKCTKTSNVDSHSKRVSRVGLDYERLHLSAYSHTNCQIYTPILQVISLSHTGDLQHSNTICIKKKHTYILISVRDGNTNRISWDTAEVCHRFLANSCHHLQCSHQSADFKSQHTKRLWPGLG